MSGGVSTFDFSPTANMIVTGGADKIIRLWHPGLLYFILDIGGKGRKPLAYR